MTNTQKAFLGGFLKAAELQRRRQQLTSPKMSPLPMPSPPIQQPNQLMKSMAMSPKPQPMPPVIKPMPITPANNLINPTANMLNSQSPGMRGNELLSGTASTYGIDKKKLQQMITVAGGQLDYGSKV